MTAEGTGDREVRDFLESSTFFGGFPADVLDRLVAVGVRRSHPRGHVLVDQDTPGESLVVIVSGTAKIVRLASDGREAVLNFLGPGDLIGEIAVLDGGLRTARAEVLEPGDFFVIQRRDLMPALRERPDALLELVTVLCEKLRATSAIVENGTGSAFDCSLPRISTASGKLCPSTCISQEK